MKLSPVPTMSREEAVSIYDDLHIAMQNMIKNVGSDLKQKPKRKKITNAYADKGANATKGVAMDKLTAEGELVEQALRTALPKRRIGKMPWQGGRQALVVIIVVGLGLMKAALGVIEFMVVTPAMASVGGSPAMAERDIGKLLGARNAPGMSRQELDLLKNLDARRVQLEERRAMLDAREAELVQKEQHVTVRIAELKDLTGRLQGERDKDSKKREAQLGQLANVYGAMAPADAAVLLDQLDIQTARSLVERMPEKRIGQLLPLMKPDRALMITQMLSGRGER